jgi:hypothetical protein
MTIGRWRACVKSLFEGKVRVMDIHDPVSVYTLTDPIKAEIIKNALEAEGIRCFLDGENQAANFGVTAFEINVLVEAGNADRARKLIESHEEHPQE